MKVVTRLGLVALALAAAGCEPVHDYDRDYGYGYGYPRGYPPGAVIVDRYPYGYPYHDRKDRDRRYRDRPPPDGGGILGRSLLGQGARVDPDRSDRRLAERQARIERRERELAIERRERALNQQRARIEQQRRTVEQELRARRSDTIRLQRQEELAAQRRAAAIPPPDVGRTRSEEQIRRLQEQGRPDFQRSGPGVTRRGGMPVYRGNQGVGTEK